MAQFLPAGILTIANAPVGPKWNFGKKKPSSKCPSYLPNVLWDIMKHMYEPYTHFSFHIMYKGEIYFHLKMQF